MVLNKKCIYLGVTLFSSAILATVSTEQVTKADTTGTVTTTTAVPSSSTDSTTAVSTTGTDSTSSSGTVSSTSSAVSGTSILPSTSTGTTSSVTTPTSTTTTSPSTASGTIASTGVTSTTATSSTVAPSTTTTSTTGTTSPISTATGNSTVTSSNTTTSDTSTTGVTSATTTSPSTTTSGTPTTGVMSATTASPSTTTSSTPTTGTTTGTTTESKPSSSSTTSTTGSTTTTTTTTTSTITIGGTTTSPSPVGPADPTSTTGTTINATTPTSSISYTIPSDVTDDTVVNFTDPTLGAAAKWAFGLKPTDNLTVGMIKAKKVPLISISVTLYELNQKNQPGASMTDQESTPVESLNGMQYFQLLPSTTQIHFQAKLASDTNADPTLTPLDNLNFAHLIIDGNFSNPKAKQIDVSQLTKINLAKTSYVELTGDNSVSSYSGIDDDQLKELGPWLTNFVNNGTSGGVLLELGSAAITDFSPLKGINPDADASIISLGDGSYDPTPVYGVIGQPLTFKAAPFTGIDGEDLSSTYHFTGTVPKADLADDNLVNLGNGEYRIDNPDSTNNVLTYGHIGYVYSQSPDAYIRKTYGTNNTFMYFGIHGQPIIWQAHPTVTINYMNADGTPIMANGTAMTKQIAGTNVGDAFDLTSDSNISGYSLSSPTTILKGAYTLAPQVVNLVYSKAITSGGSSSSDTLVNDNKENDEPDISDSRIPVDVQEVTGTTKADSELKSIGVKATTTIDGKLFYLVGYGNWIEADSYDATVSTESGVIRTHNIDSDLVDGNGDDLGYGVAPSTGWKYSKIVAINGKGYYQVATNEYLPIADAVVFSPFSSKATVSVGSKAELYNSLGEDLGKNLPSNSSWTTDGTAIINGVLMYRVATDEWVSVDTTEAASVTTTYHATEETALYDSNGNVIPRRLAADTDWKVDQIVLINGQEYCRVATDEYVKA